MERNRTTRLSVYLAVRPLLASHNLTLMRLEVERAATLLFVLIIRILYLQGTIMDILLATTIIPGRYVISLSGPKPRLAGVRRTKNIVSSGLFPLCSHLTTPMCFMLRVIMYFAQPTRGAVGELLVPISLGMILPRWNLQVAR